MATSSASVTLPLWRPRPALGERCDQDLTPGSEPQPGVTLAVTAAPDTGCRGSRAPANHTRLLPQTDSHGRRAVGRLLPGNLGLPECAGRSRRIDARLGVPGGYWWSGVAGRWSAHVRPCYLPLAWGHEHRVPRRHGRAPGSVPGDDLRGEMSALAVAHDAINLGQGFPDTDGPASMLAAAVDAINDGHQYPPGIGVPVLRQAVSRHQRAHYGPRLRPGHRRSLIRSAPPGRGWIVGLGTRPRVVMIEPYYDSYAATVRDGRAGRRTVPLSPDGDGFPPDRDLPGGRKSPRRRP